MVWTGSTSWQNTLKYLAVNMWLELPFYLNLMASFGHATGKWAGISGHRRCHPLVRQHILCLHLARQSGHISLQETCTWVLTRQPHHTHYPEHPLRATLAAMLLLRSPLQSPVGSRSLTGKLTVQIATAQRWKRFNSPLLIKKKCSFCSKPKWGNNSYFISCWGLKCHCLLHVSQA